MLHEEDQLLVQAYQLRQFLRRCSKRLSRLDATIVTLPVTLLQAYVDRDGASTRGVIYRVVQQIKQYLFQSAFVSAYLIFLTGDLLRNT